MKSRRRINVSVDPETYEKLQQLTAEYNFKNACELLVSFAHILLDRMEAADKRRYDLPDDDGQYIDAMFDDLGHVQPTPAGEVPKKHINRKCT
jgi:hypothetical protein